MTNKFSRMAMLLSAVAGLALLPAAALADAQSEIVNAATHAGLAAGSAEIAGVHTHLHHALNCLVGPAGKGFDAKEMNPCAQAGSGAIPDTTDAAKKSTLQAAAAKARRGIAATDLATAQRLAGGTKDLLAQAARPPAE